VAGRWISPGTPVSSTNKTYCHDITEILLKVVLNTISYHNHMENIYKLRIWLCQSSIAITVKIKGTGDFTMKISRLGKESLNSDGQQFHQYQQKNNNYLSPQIIDGHDIAEILLKLALNTLTLTLIKPLNKKKDHDI
jgi:hypothetical protein